MHSSTSVERVGKLVHKKKAGDEKQGGGGIILASPLSLFFLVSCVIFCLRITGQAAIELQ